MKKILYALMALATVTLFSCGDDDSSSDGDGGKGNLTVNLTVNVQPMYETFDITSDMHSFLKSNKIKVLTYVYNNSGKLVTADSTMTSNLDAVTMPVSGLASGSYTFVTLESAYVSSGSNHTPWEITGTSKLSTLSVEPVSSNIGIKYALGVSTQTVNVSGNQSVTVTPAAVGSKINVLFENFDQSSCVNLAFATWTMTMSYSLDPSVAADKRCTYNTGDSALCLRAETTTAESVGDTLSVYVLDKSIGWMLCYQTQENENTDYWYYMDLGNESLTDGSTYYCGIKYISDDASPKYYFGNKSGFDDWENGVVTFVEPCIDWGATVSTVNTFMNGYTQYKGSSTKAAYDSNYGYYYTSYYGKNAEMSFVYFFENSTKGLNESCAYYDASEIGDDQLLQYLNEKYVYLGEDSGIYEFCTADKKTVVGLMEYEEEGYSNIWALMFIDYSTAGNSAKASTMQSIAKADEFAISMRRYSFVPMRKKARRGNMLFR